MMALEGKRNVVSSCDVSFHEKKDGGSTLVGASVTGLRDGALDGLRVGAVVGVDEL